MPVISKNAIGVTIGSRNFSFDWATRYISALSVVTTGDKTQTITATIVGTGYDGASFEYTIDNGLTWTIKGTATDGIFSATGLTEDTIYSWRARLYKGVSYGSYSPEATKITWTSEYKTIWDALTTSPSQSNADFQNAFLKTLLDGSVWSDIDSVRFLCQSVNSANEALIDWKDVTKIATLHGATPPEFISDIGFEMKKADSRYIDLLWKASEGVNYTLNNACIFVYIATDVNEAAYDVGDYDGTYWAQIFRSDHSGGHALGAVINGGNSNPVIIDYVGLLVCNRLDATHSEVYHKGVKLGVTFVDAVQAALSTASMWLGARHDPAAAQSPSSKQYSLIGFAKALTATKITVLTNAFNIYLNRATALSPFIMADRSETALDAMRTTILARIYPGGVPVNGIDHITTGVAEPLSSSAAELASIDQLTLHITGISDRTPYVWHPNTPNGKFVIWSVGHYWADTWQTYVEAHGEANLIRALIDEGYTVCGILLPPGNDGTEGKVHSYPGVAAPYETVVDLHYFIETTIRIINEYEGSFTEFYRGGHSGGGTSAAYLGALDERITKTVLNCSPLPSVAMDAAAMAYDWEQGLPGLDDIVEFGDLFAMATTNNRRVLQSLVMNEATFNLATYIFAPYADKINSRFQLAWDDTVTDHGVSAAALTKIVNFFNA